jgi:hypothetical protein
MTSGRVTDSIRSGIERLLLFGAWSGEEAILYIRAMSGI